MTIYGKLLAIQTELKAPKDQYNDFGKYPYRNLESILEAVKPLLVKHGVVLTLTDELVLVGDRYYIKATARLTDTEAAESTSATAYAREDATRKGMDGAQITGAASTYARKYAVSGLLDIDDSRADPDAAAAPTQDQAPARTPIYCADCKKVIYMYTNEKGKNITPERHAQVCLERFGRVLCLACIRKETKANAK